MEDFLKDRPVISPSEATIVAPTPATTVPGGVGSFARIVREGGSDPASRPAATAKPGAPGKPAPREAAHTSQIKTVVENGRITRLIVTCSCGKITEIACQY